MKIDIRISALLNVRDSFRLTRDYINAMPCPDAHLETFNVAREMIVKLNDAISATHNGHDHWGEEYLEPKAIAPEGSCLAKKLFVSKTK